MVKNRFLVKLFFMLSAVSSLLILSPLAQAASITVTADRNPVSINESFHLIYKIDGSVDDDPDFSPLEKYLDILSRSQSSNMSIINGKYSSSKTWTLTVMAKQQGKFTLPPISFGSDKSLSYQLKVKAASKNDQAEAQFYSRLEVDQQQAYAQQQIVITQKLFSARNLSGYGLGDLDFNGSDVVVRQLGDEKQYTTQISGRQYLVIERRYAVFAQSDGLLQVSPVLAEGQLPSGRNSLFGSLGGGQIVRARSNALTIAVLPVPANVGVDPWLPARHLELTEQWPQNPPQFVEGEPVTRTLSIKAEGLTAAQLPELPALSVDGWKQYPDQPLLNDIDNDDGVTGYRVEKVALIPTRSGEMTLPAIEIKWWNTLTQQVETARIPERKVQVRAATPAAVQAPPPAMARQAPVAPVTPQTESDRGSEAESIPALSAAANGWPRWDIVSALLAAGWLLTLMLWYWQAHRKNTATPSTTKPVSAHRKDWIKPLKAACEQQNLSALRNALQQWGEQQFAQSQGMTLQQLSERLPAALAQDIRALDAVLYGAKGKALDCHKIVQGVEQFMRQQQQSSLAAKSVPLEPLYR